MSEPILNLTRHEREHRFFNEKLEKFSEELEENDDVRNAAENAFNNPVVIKIAERKWSWGIKRLYVVIEFRYLGDHENHACFVSRYGKTKWRDEVFPAYDSIPQWVGRLRIRNKSEEASE